MVSRTLELCFVLTMLVVLDASGQLKGLHVEHGWNEWPASF